MSANMENALKRKKKIVEEKIRKLASGASITEDRSAS